MGEGILDAGALLLGTVYMNVPVKATPQDRKGQQCSHMSILGALLPFRTWTELDPVVDQLVSFCSM